MSLRIFLNTGPGLSKNILCGLGLTKGKKQLSFGKIPDHILGTKNPEFSKVPFSMYF